MALNDAPEGIDNQIASGSSRRQFLRYGAAAVASVLLASHLTGCDNTDADASPSKSDNSDGNDESSTADSGSETTSETAPAETPKPTETNDDKTIESSDQPIKIGESTILSYKVVDAPNFDAVPSPAKGGKLKEAYDDKPMTFDKICRRTKLSKDELFANPINTQKVLEKVHSRLVDDGYNMAGSEGEVMTTTDGNYGRLAFAFQIDGDDGGEGNMTISGDNGGEVGIEVRVRGGPHAVKKTLYYTTDMVQSRADMQETVKKFLYPYTE